MKALKMMLAIGVIAALCSGCGGRPANPVVPAHTGATLSRMPTAAPTATSTPTATPSPTPMPALTGVNEDNFTQWFQLGMSGADVLQRLKDCGVELSAGDYGIYDGAHGSGFEIINAQITEAESLSFYLDDRDRLYMLSASEQTARGLKAGDTEERVEQLYGQADETDEAPYQYGTRGYVYYRPGWFFSVNTSFNPQRTVQKVDGWSVFVDIWNEPAFSQTSPSASLHGDDAIRFTEDTFADAFPFGMSRKALEQKLTKLGVRITNEYDTALAQDTWYVFTDHITFSFDDKDKLFAIRVTQWDTAKGFATGEPAKMLHTLYGKQSSYVKVRNEYIYKMNGFCFSVFFNTLNQADSWVVYTHE